MCKEIVKKIKNLLHKSFIKNKLSQGSDLLAKNVKLLKLIVKQKNDEDSYRMVVLELINGDAHVKNKKIIQRLFLSSRHSL